MKKFFYGLILFVGVFLLLSYTLLFTSFGNGILANFIEDKIKQRTALDVKIDHFVLRFSKLNMKANVANIADFDLEGDFDLFKLDFEFAYTINLDYAQKLSLNLDEDLVFKGQIQGRIDDFIVNGEGYLLGSNVFLDARIYDYSPIVLNLHAKDLQIDALLGLFGYAKFAKGSISIMSQIRAKDLKADGNAIIEIDNTYINYAKIKEEFDLDLPENSHIKSKIVANIKEDKIYIVSKTYNDYVKLQTQKTLYDLSKKMLSSDFNLKIAELAKLERLSKTKLSGALELMGHLHMFDRLLRSFNAQILGLDGEVTIALEDKELKGDIRGANLQKILALIGYGGLANGILDASLSARDLKFENFDAYLKLHSARVNTKEVERIFNLQLPPTHLSFDAKANANDGNIFYDMVLASNLVNIKQLNGSYKLKNEHLEMNLNALIEDLSQFNTIVGQNLQGKADLRARAHIAQKKVQNFNAHMDIANGSIKAHSNGKNLDLNIDKLDLFRLFSIVGMPHYASGIANANIHLTSMDFNNLNGRASVNLKGVLNAALLSRIMDKKFPNDTHYDLRATINFKDHSASFDSMLSSSLVNLSSFKGEFDINEMILKSHYMLDIDDFSKLAFLLDRRLEGRASFNGDIIFDKGLNFNASSEDFFGGKLHSVLKNNILNFNLNSVNLSTLARGFNLIDLYEGRANLRAKYDLLSKKGELDVDMKEGRLKSNALTTALQIVTLKDITRDVFHTARAKALIDAQNITFDLHMQAQHSHVLINEGMLNSKSAALNLPFDIRIDRANFKGSVGGSIQKPTIRLDAGSVFDSIMNIIGDKDETKKMDQMRVLDQLFDKIF